MVKLRWNRPAYLLVAVIEDNMMIRQISVSA